MKRYTQEELKVKLEELVYDYLANDNKLYFQQKVEATGKNVPTLIFEDRDKLRKDIIFRVDDYTNRMNETDDKNEKSVYADAIQILNDELNRVSDISIEKQKKLYAETKDVFVSHSFVVVPLNKKINALYDDFNISCCFFDDLANEKGVEEFSKLRTKAQKLEYVKSHVEITHMVLSLSSSTHAGIAITGEFKEQYTEPSSQSAEILPVKYSDWENITLAECEEIANNDLKQMVQERIDMDKEQLTLKAEMNVRGDVYKIYQSKSGKEEYIRYVCPSTGRVYYNAIDTRYLSESKYFEQGNYDSYILAWYSINNLFMELDEEALALNTIRC